MKRPILTIAIPTYNRAAWLQNALYNWQPQVNEFPEEVELLVVDNASTDSTGWVVDMRQDAGHFRYIRNPENLGADMSQRRIAAELATGEYLWMIGDDDLPLPGAVKTVIETIKANPWCSYFNLNMRIWYPTKPPETLIDAAEIPAAAIRHEDERTLQIPLTAMYPMRELQPFTFIGISILSREHYTKAWDKCSKNSIDSEIPLAFYIVNNLFSTPSIYIGKPLLLFSGVNGWGKHYFSYILVTLQRLYDDMLANGTPAFVVKEHRRMLLREGAPYLWWYLKSRLFLAPRDTCAIGSFKLLPFVHKHWGDRDIFCAAAKRWIQKAFKFR